MKLHWRSCLMVDDVQNADTKTCLLNGNSWCGCVVIIAGSKHSYYYGYCSISCLFINFTQHYFLACMQVVPCTIVASIGIEEYTSNKSHKTKQIVRKQVTQIKITLRKYDVNPNRTAISITFFCSVAHWVVQRKSEDVI